MKRRHVLVAVGLVAALMAAAWPSSAGSHQRFTGKGADASWYLGDAMNTAVSVGVFDGSFASPPGRALREKNLFVDVYQAWCDQSTDELVEREYFTYEPASNAVVSVSSKLDRASASGHVDLVGFEVRSPSCDNPDYENQTYTDLGEFAETVQVAWTGIGTATRSSSNFHFNGGPDCKFSSHSASKYRDADAAGTLSGDLTVGSLEGLAYADLFSTRDMSIDIGNGCFLGK